MNELLKIMDEQMLKWIKELDDLHKIKTNTDKAIQQLEEHITKAREIKEILKAE